MIELPPRDAVRLRGGGRALAVAVAVAVPAWLLLAVGLAVTPDRMLYSYLVSWAYWAGLSLGALCWLMTFHAAGTRWAVSARRVLEVQAATVGLFLPLFLPVFAGMKRLYPWVSPRSTDSHLAFVSEHGKAYLNVTGFVFRTIAFFVLCILVSHFLLRWSRRQDESREIRPTLWQRRLGAVALPVFGVGLTFGAFDWLMSLQPTWRSSVFAVYYFAGAFVASLALLIVLLERLERAGPLRGLLGPDHYHNLGKLLFAFVCFWAYIAFSQYMLQWIADLPESEVPYYLLRRRHGWSGISALLAIGHFVIPFCLLLSADFKKRPRKLAAVSLWILFVHFVDAYWMVMPQLAPSPELHWQDFVAFVAVGAPAFAFGLHRLRGDYAAPVGDPYFEDSVAFHP